MSVQMTVESTENPTECANCKQLREEVARQAVDRQRLLELLATERERSNAFFVGYPPQGNAFERVPPTSSASAWVEKPLRYKIADKLNDAMKKALPGAHGVARRAVTTIKRMRPR